MFTWVSKACRDQGAIESLSVAFLSGKFLLLAALFKCLDPALTIAATLNSKSPFVVPFGREQEADTVKQSFKKGRGDVRNAKSHEAHSFGYSGDSDFLTIANVFAVWRKMSDNPNAARVFCRRNFLSQQVCEAELSSPI